MKLFDFKEPEQLGTHSYWPTPAWFAQLIVERFFAHLTGADHIIEPCAGDGRFLDALVGRCTATGIELQAPLAAKAQAKGHQIIVGDIATVPLPANLTGAIQKCRIS